MNLFGQIKYELRMVKCTRGKDCHYPEHGPNFCLCIMGFSWYLGSREEKTIEEIRNIAVNNILRKLNDEPLRKN